MSIEAEQRKGDRPGLATAEPQHCLVAHRVGRIVLGVANNGSLGAQNTPALGDCFTGRAVPDCEYPKNSQMQYLYSGAFWIGAVVGRDTLVSVGADGWQRTQEMFPDEAPFGKIIKRSISDPESPEYEGAISEEDYIAVYTDTLTEGVDNDFFGRPHRPLNIEVTQSSFAWSYSYAEDFVLFDYRIRNIGSRTLQDVYMGIYIDADVKWEKADAGFDDDICGFLNTAPPDTIGSCEYIDSSVFTAWIADNDGDFTRTYDGQTEGAWPAPAVTATRIVRTPQDSLDVSFNWWIGHGQPSLDFGPRERPFMGRWKEPLRDFRTGGMGTPEGDANKYYVMRNREFDYDQIYTASIQPNDSLWLYPNQNQALEFATGYDTRYLLSFGPFDIDPNQTLPVSFAYVAGDSLHKPGNLPIEDFIPGNPDGFYDQLDFSDLAKNSQWASWIYDNPGVDTDGDGYAGEVFTCVEDSVLNLDSIPVIDSSVTPWDTFAWDYDSVWVYTEIIEKFISGDGVPDFEGAKPPPAPDFWLEPERGRVRVRFNGFLSETTPDQFAALSGGDSLDFEGYRIYIARDERGASYSVLASYDRENYNKYVQTGPQQWELKDTPFSLSKLRCLYGSGENPCYDSSFHPLNYGRNNPFVHPLYPDSSFYFESQDWNVSELGVDTPIEKIYPTAPRPAPGLTPDSISADSADIYLTEDGYFKYYEYQMWIENLLPSVPWYVNVTAFDYGAPASGLASLETPVANGAKMTYAIEDWDAVQSENLDIFVWPNPYRIDAAYQDRGVQGRNSFTPAADRNREINFGNLPPKCTIRIYTLDGDLVREIIHDVDNPPTDRHCFAPTVDCWNLITRNTQLAVSGLYYWTVEQPNGDVQIGKVSIIM